MTSIIDLWRQHGTKILGYASIIAAAIAVMDQQLVTDTLGPHAVRWALLISGILTALRGHTNTIRARNEALTTTEIQR